MCVSLTRAKVMTDISQCSECRRFAEATRGCSGAQQARRTMAAWKQVCNFVCIVWWCCTFSAVHAVANHVMDVVQLCRASSRPCDQACAEAWSPVRVLAGRPSSTLRFLRNSRWSPMPCLSRSWRRSLVGAMSATRCCRRWCARTWWRTALNPDGRATSRRRRLALTWRRW